MSSSAAISVQTAILGEVRADPSQIRGEGAGVCPMLVVPITIELEPRPQRVVVTELWAGLNSPTATSRPLTPMTRAIETQQPRGSWLSAPDHSMSHRVELRVPLNPLQLTAIEHLPVQDGSVHLQAELQASIAWLRDERPDVLGPGSGIALDLLPMSWVRMEDLRLAVPVTHWAERVLPGLGVDEYRAVLVRLPSQSPVTPDHPLVKWFDQARTKYDTGDWRGCIERCRDVRRGVERALNTTRKRTVSQELTETAGLPPQMNGFLEGLWKALADTTNEAHHPEWGEPTYRAADARAVLLSTAVALEYLAALSTPPPMQ